MSNNWINSNNTIVTTSYAEEINEFLLHIENEAISMKAQATLQKKLHEKIKVMKQLCSYERNSNTLIETQLKQQTRESLLTSLEFQKSRLLEHKKQLLLVTETDRYIVEKRNNNIKKLEEKWLTCKERFEKIPFIKRFKEKNDEIEPLKKDINTIISESDKIRSVIKSKKIELINMRNKIIVELADYMINKKPMILKCILEETNAMKMLKNEKKINNKLPASIPTKPTIEAKTISNEDSVSASRNNACDTFVLPKLHLVDMDSASINFDQNMAFNKRPFESLNTTRKFHTFKKAKFDKNTDSTNLTTPKKTDSNNTRNYSDNLIRILEDVKLDTIGTYNYFYKLNPYQLKEVNVIKARESQHDLKSKEPPQDNDNEQLTEEIEEIDLTHKASQDIILPPTQFLDFTRSPQEKRVTFNSVITIEDLPNMVTDDVIPQEEDNVVNNTPNSQINTSTTSDDSYRKIKDFVFKKHNVISSPEFKYTKNSVVPLVAENKIITSKFFDKKQEGNNNNIDTTKPQNMEIIEIVNDDQNQPKPVHEIPAEILNQSNITVPMDEIPAETIDQSNITADNLFEGQESTKKDDAPLAAPSFADYVRNNMPCSLNISMNTTGCEQDDLEFPQCIDSSLLLSPKADDETTNITSNNIEAQSQGVPSFFSGFRKPGLSLFGNTSSSANNPEADAQKQNFNFTFGGNEKTKKGGFFSMFQ